MPEQNFKVFLSFKDEATGKFIKATEDQINSMKKLGLTIKKEGGAAAIDIDKMGKAMTEAGRCGRFLDFEIKGLMKSLGSLRNTILVYMFGLRPFINFTKESIEAAQAQEDAERRLAAAFAATGTGSRAGANAIIEQANALQTLTGASDNEIISAASILATYKLNEQQIQRLLPLLVDMSKLVRSRSGEEMSLASIAKATGQAFSSNASRLEYLGIKLDETTKKTKDFDIILKAIAGSVSGAAAAMAGTFSGQMKIYAAAMHEYHESLGNIITKSPYFIAVIQLMTGEINKHNEALKNSQAQTDNFAEAWRRILAALVGVWTVLNGMINVIKGVGLQIDIIVIGISEFISKVLLGVNAIIIALLSVIPATKGIQEQLIKAGDEIDLWRETFKITNENLIKDMNSAADSLFNMTGSAVDLYAKILEGASNVSAQMKIDVKGLIGELDNLQNETGAKFNAMQTFMQSFATGARDAIVDGLIKVVKLEFSGLKDVVVSFGDIMLKTIMQIIVNLMLMAVWSKAAGFLGFAGGLAGGLAGHTGGYLLSLENSFGYRKKFHSGGEVPATLLEGEGVVNRAGMRSLGVDNLNKLNRGEQAGGGAVVNNYYIQTIDERSFRERLQQHGDIYANASEGAIRDNSSLRSTSQRWG